MVRPLGIGLIGHGGAGKIHALGYRSLSSYYDPLPVDPRLVGVCTSSEMTGAKAQKEHGFEFHCADYRHLLERNDISLIDCCVPNFLHRDMIIDAIKAGKHVYCEKPLAMNLKEAEEIVKFSRQSAVKCQIVFNYRFIPAVMRAKQLAAEGALGEIFSFRGAYLHSGYIDPHRPITWRLQRDKAGGGALIDLGPHIIDMLQYLLGEFNSVFANTKTITKRRPSKDGQAVEEVDVDDIAILQLKLKNGGIGTIETSRFATGTNDDLRIEVDGSKGSLVFNLMDPNWLFFYDATEEDKPTGGRKGFKRIETVQHYPEPAVFPYPKSTVGWSRFHIASQYQFIKAIALDLPPEPSFEDGLAVQRVIEAAYLSSEQGEWIDLASLVPKI
ncbi:MAG: Glucose-6-phosphate 3-dehydrogenase [Chloroflexi bacterium]|nr:Glucose-6-phosphate 3-dehydrogenase [Chloroflexota bacterium]